MNGLPRYEGNCNWTCKQKLQHNIIKDFLCHGNLQSDIYTAKDINQPYFSTSIVTMAKGEKCLQKQANERSWREKKLGLD